MTRVEVGKGFYALPVSCHAVADILLEVRDAMQRVGKGFYALPVSCHAVADIMTEIPDAAEDMLNLELLRAECLRSQHRSLLQSICCRN